MYPKLKFILYLIENLTDENFGRLLHLFYGHYNFFPHDKWSNKELFLNILLYKWFPICELNIDKNQFIQDAYYYLVSLQNKNWKALENAKETNSYYKIHNFLLNNEKLSESLITDQKHLNTLYLEYEKIRHTYENKENYLLECINYIILSINSYNLDIDIQSKTFKTFLNKYIENMCQYHENMQNEEYKNYRGYCYIINDNSIEKIIFSHDNTIKKEKYTLKEEENILKLTNDHGCEKIIKNYNKICNDNKDSKNNIFALKGSKDIKRVKNINAALDEAITEYKKTVENNMDFCHICNPIYLNENHKKLKGQTKYSCYLKNLITHYKPNHKEKYYGKRKQNE